jgi:choline dehydrogenase-like flavoprotein
MTMYRLSIMDTNEELLTQAIRARRVVSAWYRGTGAGGLRVFYPHVLYRATSGELLVDAFQVDGASGSGRLPDWRVFKLGSLRDVEVQAAVFLPLPQFDLASPRYRSRIVVHCLEPAP